ncbi:aldehyde dehydrogenase family protein [Crateriforma conspicua]|uniref:Betaine aldehyde dehydrogenase n=1 Tax=Crateriforma conspicua TaxID=2527996 RepID=A0A5C5Y189_9PLAN|nr:aldehyde dehydrogenase family protein [Crateriforma conspicua]TWT68075.1 Betaine aldehyde dehydrogenase [Crateriforma conspicua]
MFQTDRKLRCRVVGAARHHVARRIDALVDACRSAQRTMDSETVAAELIPLCDALKFIADQGPKILADRRVGTRGRAVWLWGVQSRVQRVPWGDVLILAAWNYPLLLPGVQMAQALAAGNCVWVKPAPGCESATRILVDCFFDAGVPTDCLSILDSTVDAATRRIDQGVDLVVLTGGVATGRTVMHALAETVTPSIMELSGCDAMVVLPGADLDRVASAVRFGLTFNAGATCIGPRRLLIGADGWKDLSTRLSPMLSSGKPLVVHPSALGTVVELVEEALDRGARDFLGLFDLQRLRNDRLMHPLILTDVPDDCRIGHSDVFAPVMTVDRCGDEESVVRRVNDCPYRLAASVFGPHDQARRLADRLWVGSVVVNDLIAPTADARLPFGGRGESGHGVTRGPEGLLSMTTVRVISRRKGSVTPHLSPPQQSDADLLSGSLAMTHGKGWRQKWQGLKRVVAAARRR